MVRYSREDGHPKEGADICWKVTVFGVSGGCGRKRMEMIPPVVVLVVSVPPTATNLTQIDLDIRDTEITVRGDP